MQEVDAKQFVQKYCKGALGDALLLDVREWEEWEEYRLEEAVLIPLGNLPAVSGQLDRQRKIYVLCAHGVRSQYACHFLMKAGFNDVVNVQNGLATVRHYLEERVDVEGEPSGEGGAP